MSTTTRQPPPVPAAERGGLLVPDRVVEKVAMAAAAEVDGVHAAPATGLRRVFGGSPRIEASVRQPGGPDPGSGPVAEVSLEVSIRYPLPVFSTAGKVRDHVAERVLALTGRTVTDLRIEVTHFTHAAELRPRRVA
jgi:uncharacterized alkaline shock family protein YloU